MGFDFIVIVPLLPSHFGFSFVFGYGESFLVSSIVFLLMIIQQLVVMLVLSLLFVFCVSYVSFVCDSTYF